MKKGARNFVLGLGGSVIFPHEINTLFLKKFFLFIERHIKQGKKFVIVAGGGKLARILQKGLNKISKFSQRDKDILGIEATKINAQLLKIIFKKFSCPQILDKRFKIKDFKRYKIIIASGWRPGFSTDFVAVQIAKDFKIKKIVLISNIDYVYDKDPKKYKDAKPIKKISWEDYLKLIPSKWRPGLNAPVDPVAARFSKKNKLEVILASASLSNLEKILEGKEFKGTIISP